MASDLKQQAEALLRAIWLEDGDWVHDIRVIREHLTAFAAQVRERALDDALRAINGTPHSRSPRKVHRDCYDAVDDLRAPLPGEPEGA